MPKESCRERVLAGMGSRATFAAPPSIDLIRSLGELLSLCLGFPLWKMRVPSNTNTGLESLYGWDVSPGLLGVHMRLGKGQNPE